jgi:hypothetical protein
MARRMGRCNWRGQRFAWGHLMRRKLPFVEVEGLSVGTVLPFTDATLTEIRLEDVTGRAVLRGRFGQKSGMRAVRLGKEITMRATGGLAPQPAAAPLRLICLRCLHRL